jgi:hypothetical protein
MDSPASSALSDSSSSASSSSGDSNTIKDLLFDEPMFHVLGQFLVSGSKNVAEVAADLVAEVAKLRGAVAEVAAALRALRDIPKL